ncbi:MAG: precorrin-8X methylmutase [Deltaproteobacteria bacterium]|nr:precorrin-8X methylmutase [Deltaproteobacteria bacterium]
MASDAPPLILSLYASPLTGEAIEALSLERIEREVPSHRFAPAQWQVVRRMIHATADFGLLEYVRFSPDAVEAGAAALRAGRPLYADSNMIRAGLSLNRLREACPTYGRDSIVCHVADEDVARQSVESGLPRSLFAVRKARATLDGGIALIGNAPVALLELNRLVIEEGIRPAFVIAMPVGFVHVEESKQELMSLGMSFVAVSGRRGGSPMAVSALHALCSAAARRSE